MNGGEYSNLLVMKRFFLILTVVLGPIIVSGQVVDTISTPASPFTSILSLTKSNIIDNLSLKNKEAHVYQNSIKVKSPSLAHTAFFCKIEDKIGKSSNLPLKMRLGDIDYVDAIEGKRVVLLPRQ